MKHILLENLFTYKKRKGVTTPKNYDYNRKIGAWICVNNENLLVNDKCFPSIASKKRDIETGEDEKGQ